MRFSTTSHLRNKDFSSAFHDSSSKGALGWCQELCANRGRGVLPISVEMADDSEDLTVFGACSLQRYAAATGMGVDGYYYQK